MALLVVSNRAPVEVAGGARGRRLQRTVGGLAGALDDALRDGDGTWIAWIGGSDEAALAPETTGLGYRLRPVALPARDVRRYYLGFATQVLWPLCHTFPDRCRFEPSFWDAYRRANARFAHAIRAEARPGDLVWVHDFHLSLVPGLLRAARTPVRVGVFWHVPFPPAPAFAVCPWREEILGGLLGADLVGFQTPADARHFLDGVRQLLDLRIAHDPPRVVLPTREVRVLTLPIGIDAARFRATAAEPAVRERAARLRAALGAEVVLVGVDRLDYTKGVLERLRGYERFLERRPNWRGRACLVQVTVPSRDRVPAYRELKRAIDEAVGRISGRFTTGGRAPIAYRYTALDREQLVAHYLAADVALVTPLRDGMNLVAKEYVAAHAAGDGALVLSEFAGAAREMPEAIPVNPWDPDAIRRRIELALTMSPDERRRRMRALARRVAARDLRWWTTAFLDALGRPIGGLALTA
jgi:trehalose 6-phosphate synthase